MKIVKEFILREIAGECVLVPTGATSQEFNGMITISDTAKFIWENIEKVDSLEEMIQMVLDTYEIDEETARRDTIAFVGALVENGFIECTREDGTWTVNGDRSLLIREEDGWYANGWPVCGSSEICNNKSYPVRAIVMLSQAKENRISRLKGLEALRKVMEQITINAWNSEFQIQAMDELEILLKEVPVYHLECDISEDAVRCLEDVLADGRGEE